MTKDQEKFLSDFADKGLAELKAAEDREVENAKQAELNSRKETALAELEAKYQAEKEKTLAEIA